jgi:hypothetical protein
MMTTTKNSEFIAAATMSNFSIVEISTGKDIFSENSYKSVQNIAFSPTSKYIQILDRKDKDLFVLTVFNFPSMKIVININFK